MFKKTNLWPVLAFGVFCIGMSMGNHSVKAWTQNDCAIAERNCLTQSCEAFNVEIFTDCAHKTCSQEPYNACRNAKDCKAGKVSCVRLSQ